MREIIFRGKRIDNDEWICGSFCMDACEQLAGLCGVDGFIRLYNLSDSKMQMFEVDRETVGQFTGLTDKNDTRIFEGDIIFTTRGSIDEEEGNAVIEWDYDTARFVIAWNSLICDFDNFYGYDLEVIGNIHDNPELIGERKDNE